MSLLNNGVILFMPNSENPGAAGDKEYSFDIKDLLKLTVEKGGSDLHLVVAAPPLVRIDGQLLPQDYPELSPTGLQELLYEILTEKQKEDFENNLELDFSYAIEGIARFRGNVVYQRGTIGAVFRAVPFSVPNIDELGLPPGVKEICQQNRGLVLVTGPTGSGKSTTLAAMINYINRHRRVNIVTVEDPIEFLHKHDMATVRQREVGGDTHSFANALRHVLRHDPDVILVGEMRDLESISIALTAAETGHLVFSTLHTQTASLTINRIVDVFPSEQRQQVRQQLATSLRGVISQQLLPAAEERGRVAAIEFMVDSNAVTNMIREGKEHQLYSVIQTSQASGMQTMDQALVELYRSGKITYEYAMSYSVDKKEMERMLKAKGASTSAFSWRE